MGKRIRTNNGLELDFNLTTMEARQDFVNNLIIDWENKGKPLRTVDLDLLADYVLYGTDSNGLSPVKEKEIEIETRYSTYDKKKTCSLESLLENPIFDENSLKPLTQKTPYKKTRPNFNREEVSDKPEFQELFYQIDTTAALIDYHLKSKPLDSFSSSIQEFLLKTPKPSSLNLYKMRHLLVELRREQFTIRDHYFPILQETGNLINYSSFEEEIQWETDQYSVAPLGIFTPNNPLFTSFLSPKNFSSSDPIYKKPPHTQKTQTLDFLDTSHIYLLLKSYNELRASVIDKPDSTLNFILNTLDFYIQIANFNEESQEILVLKIQKYSNEFISSYINRKYNKKHTPN